VLSLPEIDVEGELLLQRYVDRLDTPERVHRFGDNLGHRAELKKEPPSRNPRCSNMLACLYFYLDKIFFQVMVVFVRYQLVQDDRKRHSSPHNLFSRGGYIERHFDTPFLEV